MVAEPYTTDDPETRLVLFDFAFENAPIGVAFVDIKGRIIRGNAEFAKLLSLPFEKVLGTHFRDFTHPEDIEADLILFQQVLQGSRDGYTIEKTLPAAFRGDRSRLDPRCRNARCRG